MIRFCPLNKIPNPNFLKVEDKVKTVFNFQFDPREKKFVGSLKQESLDQIIINESNQDNNNFLNTGLAVVSSSKLFTLQSSEDKLIPDKKIDIFLDEVKNIQEINSKGKEFGYGIKTFRLFGNKIYDLEDLKREENDEDENDEEEENALESPIKVGKGEAQLVKDKEEFDEEDGGDSEAKYQSMASFKAFLGNKKSKKFNHSTNLRYVSVSLILSLLILSFTGFFVMKAELDAKSSDQSFIVLSNKRNSEVMTIMNIVNQLILVNKNWVFNPFLTENKLRSIL